MTTTGQVIGAAVAVVWLGIVLAIFFLETPVKFRAPGITVPLAPGYRPAPFPCPEHHGGRSGHRADRALLTNAPGAAGWTLFVVTAALLPTQAVLLRPRLDRRAQ